MNYTLCAICMYFLWCEDSYFHSSAPTDEAFESELQLALEMSRSESQEVKEEIPLVESNKENQQQVEVEGEKAEENPDASSNILDKTDMTSDGPSIICDINNKRESNFKPGKKILHH